MNVRALANVVLIAIVSATLVTPLDAKAQSLSQVNGCTVHVPPVVFPASDYTTRTKNTFVDVSVTCPAGISYSVSLLDPAGCGATRTMQSGTVALHYSIMTPDGTGIWCDGFNGTRTVAGLGTGTPQHYIAPAVIIAPATSITKGRYVDAVQVTVSY